MSQARSIINLSLLNLSILVVSVLSIYVFQSTTLAFFPLFFSMIVLALGPLAAGPSVILTYVAFDGMLKILSGYNPIIHVGADLLVVFLVFRWMVAVRYSQQISKNGLPPFLILFLMHFVWISVEIINPFGIGFVPSLAGFKVYVSFLTLFFITYLSMDKIEEFKALFIIALVILTGEILLSLVQFHFGAKSVLLLSANYNKAMRQSFVGSYFRPFGTSSNPGAVSAWAFVSMPILLGVFLLARDLWTRAGVLLLSVGNIYLLFISQVRANFLKALVAVGATFIFIYLRSPSVLVLGTAVGLALLIGMRAILLLDIPGAEIARDRFAQLWSLDFILNARGQGVWNSILYVWQNAPFGMGLTRIGAAAGVFKTEIASNPYYGLDWTFADNLYRALMVEIGLPGTLLYMAFFAAPVILIVRRLLAKGSDARDARLLVASCLGLAVGSFVGQWGSEGCLYLPECAYYWIFMGAAVRFSEARYLHPAQRVIHGQS